MSKYIFLVKFKPNTAKVPKYLFGEYVDDGSIFSGTMYMFDCVGYKKFPYPILEMHHIVDDLILREKVQELITKYEQVGYKFRYIVLGSTYEHKEKLKQMGFKYDGYNWYCESITKDIIKQVNDIGLKMSIMYSYNPKIK